MRGCKLCALPAPTSARRRPPPARPLQREGLGGFYKGLAPNVLRVMPQSALTFLVYESVMQLLAAQAAAPPPPAGGGRA